MTGFIKLYREFLQSDLLQNPLLLQVWIFLNTRVWFRATEIDGIEIQPGQVLISAGEIARACDLTENKVRYALDALAKKGLLQRENIRCRYSLITLTAPSAEQPREKKADAKPTEQPKPQPQKECCGICMNVYLTKEERRTLQERSPAADNYIDNLSAYKRRTGKEYKDDFPVLIEWMCKDEIKKAQSDEPPHDEPPRIRQAAPPREQTGPQYDRHGLTTTTSYDLELAEYIARTSVPVLRKRNRAGG